MAETCLLKTTRHDLPSLLPVIAAMRPWNESAAFVRIDICTFAISTRNARICSPTRIRMARVSFRPCDHCIQMGNSIRSRSHCCSVQPGLQKNCMNGKVIAGRSRTLFRSLLIARCSNNFEVAWIFGCSTRTIMARKRMRCTTAIWPRTSAKGIRPSRKTSRR